MTGIFEEKSPWTKTAQKSQNESFKSFDKNRMDSSELFLLEYESSNGHLTFCKKTCLENIWFLHFSPQTLDQ